MKMYKVFIEGWKEQLVGKIEMEYLVMVFGDKAQVTEIELTKQKGSANLVGDENNKCQSASHCGG